MEQRLLSFNILGETYCILKIENVLFLIANGTREKTFFLILFATCNEPMIIIIINSNSVQKCTIVQNDTQLLYEAAVIIGNLVLI